MLLKYYAFPIVLNIAQVYIFSFQIDKIAAPTQASIRQSTTGSRNPEKLIRCAKIRTDENESLTKVPQSRRWWSETTRHLTNIRENLVQKKILPPINKNNLHTKTFTNTLIQATCKIDELVAKSSENFSIPIHPRLRLTRKSHGPEKILLPVKVTIVEFPGEIRRAW